MSKLRTRRKQGQKRSSAATTATAAIDALPGGSVRSDGASADSALPAVRLSCCMIVRNEAAMLSECLRSLADLVDEVIVVDTGSSDNTVELALQAGAHVLRQPWRDDFSAPRNLALSAAHGDWVLVIDADERLSAQARVAIAAALVDDNFDCGLLPLHNADRLDASVEDVVAGRATLDHPQLLPRLFRRTDNLRWERIVHEQPLAWLRRGPKRMAVLEDAAIAHYGAIPQLRKALGKGARNLALLDRRCSEVPEDSASRSYLAFTLREMGEHGRAASEVARAWQTVQAQMADLVTGNMRPTCVSIATLHAQYLRDEDRFPEAIVVLETALRWNQGQLDEEHPNLTFQLGVCFESLSLTGPGSETAQLLTRADAAYSRCIAQRGRCFAEPVAPADCTTVLGWVRLGTVRLRQGEPEAASLAFDEALAAEPAHIEANLGRAEAELDLRRPMECLRRVSKLADSERPDGLVLTALACRALGDNGRVLNFVRQAVTAMQSEAFVAPHRRDRLVRLCALMRQPPVG